mmetsp:Transcript_51653/g.90205  ORF Transcript_51653/g.90205 Transcript_51653/m.90205 type:complete len:359 (+) Transcript_51653:3-1079(+)
MGTPEGLPKLEDVEVLAPHVVRVLGMNPGPATLQGTNTYLVGTGQDRILIDTSDGNRYWWPLVEQVLTERKARISDILLTHGHYDHVGGVAEVQAAFPEVRIWKAHSFCPVTENSSKSIESDDVLGKSLAPPPPPLPDDQTRTQSRMNLSAQFASRRQNCGCDVTIPTGCRPLTEDQEFCVEGAVLRVMLTPGHSVDSACFVLEADPAVQRGRSPDIFVGDTVLGGTTSKFEDLITYRRSLHLLASYTGLPGSVTLYTGHGAHIERSEAWRYIVSYQKALEQRERAIIDVLQQNGSSSVSDISSTLYGGGANSIMAESLLELHLHELVSKGRVTAVPGMFFGTYYELPGQSGQALEIF